MLLLLVIIMENPFQLKDHSQILLQENALNHDSNISFNVSVDTLIPKMMFMHIGNAKINS